MPYIIDGDNLIGSSPDISLEDPQARSKIIEIVRQFQVNKNSNVTIVFDGAPQNGVRKKDIYAKFCVVYPHNGASADDEIRHILNQLNYFRDVILITSDRELKIFAKKKGAKTVNSIEFYFDLKRISRISGKVEEKQKRIEAELSDQEVEQWMKIFDQ
jgi:uncharacterized protein